MLYIGDKILMEKINQLKKAIEIVGGKEFIEFKCKSDEDLLRLIMLETFNKETVEFQIDEKMFNILELMNKKLQYEKDFLKGKIKTVQSIVYKIKKYDTSLDSIIRKYKKTRSIEDYNKIYTTLERVYRRDINMLVLMAIDLKILEGLTIEDEKKYYGDYLGQKRKQIVDSVISKMGMV